MKTGIFEKQLTNVELSYLYGKECDQLLNTTLFDLKNNEYFIPLQDNEKVDLFKIQNKKLNRVEYPVFSNTFDPEIKPRNIYQRAAMDLLNDRKVPLKIITGIYGSGKDFLMFNKALQLIQEGVFNKIIFVRPNVEIKGYELGFLPGDADDKLYWTMAPLMDKVGGDAGLRMLLDQDYIECVPLAYIRGRQFDNSIIYTTEGQNMTTEIIKLLIGRVGENSELWINGDTHQTDRKTYDGDNGIKAAIEALGGNDLFGYVYLPLTERSEVARLADLIDEYQLGKEVVEKPIKKKKILTE